MALWVEEPVPGPDGPVATDDVCEALDANRHRVLGRELEVPMDIADCAILANVFLVPARAAQAMIGEEALRVVQPLPGRTLLVLLAVDYRDNPLGRYREAAVLLPVHPPGRRVVPGFGGISLLLQRLPHLVYRMPVDQVFTTHAGRHLWGYPKYLAEIDVELSGGQARAELRQDGELVFALRAPASDSGRVPRVSGDTLTVRGGRVRRVRGSIAGSGRAVRLGGEAPTLGDRHPLARELASLGLPTRPVLSASIAQASMRFELASDLGTLSEPAILVPRPDRRDEP